MFDGQFIFAGGIGEVGDPSLVGTPGRITFGNARRAGQIPRRAIFSGGSPDVTSRFDGDAFPAGRDRGGADIFCRVNNLRSQFRPIAGNPHFHGGRRLSLEIEQHQFRAMLQNDFAVSVGTWADRRPFNIIVGVLRDLLARPAVGVIHPDVQAMLGTIIGEIVDCLPMPHGQRVGPFPSGDLLAATGFEVEHPNIGCHTTAVSLPGSRVATVRRVCQPLAIGADGAVRPVGHRQAVGQWLFPGNGEQLSHPAEPGQSIAAEQQRFVGSPIAERFAG